MVRLYTLGRFQLVRGEPERREPVPVQEKRLALLAYLATAGPEPWVRRDTLLAAFWPELSGDDARRALRQALHYLRNLLGDGVIVARGDELAIAPKRLWCDAAQLASGPETRETLELYRGDFLAGFFAADAGPAFDDWLAASRRRLRERAVAVAWAVADAETAAGSPLAAAAAARRAVDLAPLDEPGVRRLMALLARLGDRAGALAAYADLAGRLRAEFDAAPASETEAAARQIRAQDDEAPPLEARRIPGPAAPSAVPSPGSAPGRPDRRRMAALVGGLVLVAVAILAGLILRPGSPDPASLIARGTLREQDLILVADFRDQTRDSLLAPAVTELVRVGLAEASVRVMNRRRIADPAAGWGSTARPPPTRLPGRSPSGKAPRR